MSFKAWPILMLLSAWLVCGCQHFDFRMVEPAQGAQVIQKQPVTLSESPLDYRIVRRHDRLAMTIMNPTDVPVTLLASKSYVIDPHGESHPMRGGVIGPHSHMRVFLPPVPASMTFYSSYPMYAYGPWGPFYGPYYDYPFWPYAPTYSYSYNIITPFDWRWKSGPVRLQFGYDQAGKAFEHRFTFEKYRVK